MSLCRMYFGLKGGSCRSRTLRPKIVSVVCRNAHDLGTSAPIALGLGVLGGFGFRLNGLGWDVPPHMNSPCYNPNEGL